MVGFLEIRVLAAEETTDLTVRSPIFTRGNTEIGRDPGCGSGARSVRSLPMARRRVPGYLRIVYWARDPLHSRPELVQDLIPAAQERFYDAQAAFTHGSPTGSVYLAGYCVEMVLKHAALRVDCVRPYANVRDALAPARAHLDRWIGRHVDHEQYHSLEFWALLLTQAFLHRTRTISSLVSDACARAKQLHAHWHVALRYRSEVITTSEAQDFLRKVGWFNVKAGELWR